MTFATAGTTRLSNGDGITSSAVGFSTSAARASAAASLCWSVIFWTPLSSAPRKIPGKAKELLT